MPSHIRRTPTPCQRDSRRTAATSLRRADEFSYRFFPEVRDCRPRYREFREGDVRHSQADISKARKLLGYTPTHRVREGLGEAMGWYLRSLSRQA